MRHRRITLSLWMLCSVCLVLCAAPEALLAQAEDQKANENEADERSKEIVRRFRAIDQAVFDFRKEKPPADLLDDEAYAVMKLHHEKALMAAKYYRSADLVVKEIEACEALLPLLGKTKDPFKGKRGFLERAYIAENDGSPQPYLVYVPAATPDDARLPVHAFLHGYAGDLDKVNWIQYMYSPDLEKLCEQQGFLLLMPFGRSNTEFMGVGEADVLKTIELVKRHYNVDEDRVFLTGASMGGSGAYTIGCHYPHLFAGIMTIAGRYDYYLWQDLDPQKFAGFKRIQNDTDYARNIAGNLLNVPTFIFHGSRDFVIKIEQSRGMHRLLNGLGGSAAYREIGEGDHWIWSRCFLHDDYDDWLKAARRNLFPKKVLYQTYTLKYNRAYWVTIDRLKHWGERATVEVVVKDGNRIDVNIANVAAMKLSLSDKLVDMKRPVTLTINGATEQREIGRDGETPIILEKVKPSGWVAKTHEICGPVREAYIGPILFVVGASGSEEANKENQKLCEMVAQEWATFAAGRAQIKVDKEVDEKDIAEKNLILFGTPENNLLIKRMADKLPITFEEGNYVVGEHKVPMKGNGLLMIYPNPLHSDRYIVINSGLMWGEHLSINHKLDFVPDYIIYAADRDWDAMNRYHCAGYFSQSWQIDDKLIWLGKNEQNAKKTANGFED